ncbi:MAG: Ig-like domain-containing protein [Zetaproteobacteria bacterium]|nr:Ig-like domain-containing protein [Zetaproteobacteria bacterium]
MWHDMVFKRWLLMLAVLFSLAACGGAVPSTPTAGGVAAAGNAATLAVSTLSTPVFSNVVQTSRTSATVQVSSNVADQYGAALAGVAVIFKATGIVATSNSIVKAVSGANGVATVTMTYDPNNSPTVVATAAAVTSLASVPAPHPVASIQLATSLVTAGVAADGVGSYTVVAQVKDAYGSPVIKEAINFTNTGTGLIILTPSSLVTDAGGTVRLTVTDINTTNDTVNISALAGGISTATPLTLSFVGTGTGGAGGGANAGNAIALLASVNNLPADGYTTTKVTVSVVDAAGAAVGNLPLTLSNTGSATLSLASVKTNAQGIAIFTVKDSVGEVISISVSDGTSTSVLSQTFIPAVATLKVVSSTTTVLADGKSVARLIIAAKDAQGRGVTGETLAISTNSATAFIPNIALTGLVGGQASIQISDAYAETVTVTVQSRAGGTQNGVVQSTTIAINFVKNSNAINVSIANSGVVVQGTPQVVTATVVDPAGVVVPNVVVTFSTNALVASITPASGSALTDAYGHATVNLDVVAAGAATITARATINGVAVSGNVAYSTSTIGGNTASLVGLSASKYIVLTGGKDSTQLTATVQDAANAAVSGATVNFHTTAGLLTTSQATTDAYGHAVVSLSSGSSPTNVQADVYTTVGAIESAHLPISIQGTKLSLIGKTSSLSNAAPYTSDKLTLTVMNGAGVPIPNQHISVASVVTNNTIPVSSTSTPAKLGIKSSGYQGFVIDSYTYNLTTNVSGQVVFIVDAYSHANGIENNASTLVVCLDPYAANTGMTSTTCLNPTTTSKLFRAYQVTGAAFGISLPSIDNYTMDTYTTATDIYTVVVTNAGVNATVTFATSLGTLLNPYSAAVSPLSLLSTGGYSTVTMKATALGYASIDFYSMKGGLATIQATSTLNGVQQTSFTHIIVSPPVKNVAQISLQSSSNVLAVHTTQVIAPSVNLTATVRDGYGFPVAQVPVSFSLGTATGGGESVSPSLAYTNNAGVATAVFTSGTQSSGAQGIDVYATIAAATASTVKPGKTNVIIGGTAGSVSIGRATSTVVLNPSTYQMPMSVVVADSNGNAVIGAQVTLNVWPSFFRMGKMITTAPCGPSPLAIDAAATWAGNTKLPVNVYAAIKASATPGWWLPNEDDNMNLTLDLPSEEIPWRITGNITAQQDNALTPSSSVAGTLPASVVTNANGVATFNLTYLKANSQWVKAKVTAKTVVLGTESIGVVEFTLPTLVADACFIPNSPFNAPSW